MGQRRGACRVLVGKPAGKGPLENPRRRWIFKKWDAGTWTLSLSLSLYIYIYGSERNMWQALVTAVIKCREFLD